MLQISNRLGKAGILEIIQGEFEGLWHNHSVLVPLYGESVLVCLTGKAFSLLSCA